MIRKTSYNGRMWKSGFTLVELSLAVVFVSILSITIALMITDAVRSYRRGMVLNQLNTVGMELVDDMRAAVQNAPSQAIANECAMLYDNNDTLANTCANDGAAKLVMFSKSANVTLNRGAVGTVPVSGAVCFGNYTYLWNSGYFFSDEVTNKTDFDSKKVSLKYTYGGETKTKSDFRLLKVRDELREICRMAAGVPNSYNNDDVRIGEFSLSEALGEEPIEVLSNNRQSNNLALYDLTVATPAESTAGDAMFYAASFILGTIQGGMNVNASGNFCSSPEGYEEAFDYCAINKFNFAAQAAGE